MTSYSPASILLMQTVRLNLGCCDTKREGFLGVDIVPPADILADLAQYPWPWPDSTVDELMANDVFEHLPSKRDTMNEAWRVLKPGGLITIIVPSASRGSGGFQDPTHLTYWTANDFAYYQKGNFARERFRHSSYYGVKADFKILDLTQSKYMAEFDEVWKIEAVLEALK